MQPRRGRWATILVVVAVLAAACTSGDDDSSDGRGVSGVPGGESAAGAGDFRVQLSAGEPAATQGDPIPVVGGEPLDADRVAEITSRLPDLTEDDDDRQDFNRPADTRPPPVVGEQIDQPFPAAGDEPPATPPDGPLQVERFQPEGDVEIAPFVSITFDQPMVPLSTLEQLEELDVPVVVTPDLPGRWRWIGTRTLRFEHEPEDARAPIDRLPMATEYRVEIPAGTTSESGGELAETVAFEFRTPPVQVRSVAPVGDQLPVSPVFVAVTDQIVDPAEVLESVTLTADGEDHAIRLATEDEIADDDEAREVTSRALDGRWVAFRPDEPLPADAAIAITFEAGLASAEGPLTTDSPQTFRAHTYPPFEVRRTECVSGPTCQPGADVLIEMTTDIDLDTFDPADIEIEPEVPGRFATAFANQIFVRGETSARTAYEITLPGELTDVFGQALGDDATVTVEVGDAVPVLRGFDQHLVTTDPRADSPSVVVSTIGHEELRVRVLDVDPDDWPAFDGFVRSWDREDADDLPDWTVLRDETIRTDAEEGVMGETTIDLGDELEGFGHVVVAVESTLDLGRSQPGYWQTRPTVAWVQRTDIGLDAIADHRRLIVWATDLADGTPLDGVEVTRRGTAEQLRTDADGLATFRASAIEEGHLVATRGDDSAILAGHELEHLSFGEKVDTARWHVVDDRGIYRPGDTAHLKGWVRRLTLSGDAQLAPIDPATTIAWTAFDAFGNEIGTGQTAPTAAGGFDLSVEIPADASLGDGFVEMRLEGSELLENATAHQLRLAEFRRPEFEVTARPETDGPYLATDAATVALTAEYFSGGALGDAPVAWTVRTRPGTYAPPGWDRFAFGVWTPWWFESRGDGREGGYLVDSSPCCGPHGEEEIETFEGRTDAAGNHYLQMDFAGAPEGEPVVVSANGAVTDVDRQQLADTTDLLVHAGRHYVGLRTDRTFVPAGEPVTIEAVVTDIDGEVVAGRDVEVVLERLEWQQDGNEWEEVGVDPQTCEVTSADDPVDCEITPGTGGRYRVTATVTDDDGGSNRTEITRWVSGGTRSAPDRGVEQQELTLVPDAETYADGDTAQVLVQAPFGEGTGLLTLARNGITSNETFTLDEGSATLEIPITDDLVPGIDLVVEVVGAEGPSYAVGTLRLDVPPTNRTLAVDVDPRDPELTPGDDTSVDITVTDPAGTPVEGAELAVVVVDEAVLSLTDHELADPLTSMYAPFFERLLQIHGRRTVQLARAESFDTAGTPIGSGYARSAAEGLDAVTADGGGEQAAAPAPGDSDGSDAIELRTDFDALAVFAPEVVTDAEGRATLDVPLPDNLTRYRVMVTAAAGVEDFGTGEANITARLPVQARPSAPRFLNFGDVLELPVVVQNQTDEPVVADVVLEATNLTLTGGNGVQVEVPANDRVEVRFPVEADDAGTTRVRAAVVAGEDSDAAVVELPVYTPATAEAFATYGVVDSGGVLQPLDTPEGVIPQFGGLEITTSSTSLQALTDAVVELVEYRYDHLDAHASRLLAIVALRDVLEAFAVEGMPSPEQLATAVAADIDAIEQLQNADGGFSTWRQGRESHPYRSIQAAHALLAASGAGYEVDGLVAVGALDYLTAIERHIPQDWPEDVRATLEAYALHVRMLAGDRDTAAADELFASRADVIGVDGMAWLWPLVSDGHAATIATELANRVTETPSAATFTTDYGESAHLVLASDRRTDGIVLDALIRMRPDSDLIPKVVAGLIGNQRRGSWANVQENSFILLALRSYFDAFESETPDFVARVWLGDLYAAEAQYRGRSTASHLTRVPMAELVERDDPGLVVAKDGPGRLYYRLGLRYAPDDLSLDPRDEGFVVERAYEAVDDPDDVSRRDDGTWVIRAGANVRVTLTMVADSRRTNMALVDPVPAGLEILDPDLATAVDVPPEEDAGGGPPRPLTTWWWGTWFDHQNQRDDRAEAFAAFLPAGTYEYSYVARATTPGTFVAPPARAEELYAPEVFGRSGTAMVAVTE